MSKETPIATYSGEPFKLLVRQYSNDRMKRDASYRTSVFEALQKRRAGTKPVRKHGNT